MASIVVKDRKQGVVNRKLAVGDCPECCGGALFCRAVDCCQPTRFAWFKSDLCGNTTGCPSGVVNYAGACWRFNGTGPFTEAAIRSGYPRERIFTVDLPCVPDCTDAGCPPCPDDCCYESGANPFCAENDCTCVRDSCKCGKAWTVTWQSSGTGEAGICSFPGVTPCEYYEYSASGSISWEYREVSAGICDLVMTAYTGTLFARTTVVAPCNPAGVYSDSMSVNASNKDYIYGDMYGCGYTWKMFDVLPGRMADFITGRARVAVAPCFYTFGAYNSELCNNSYEEVCGGQPGYPGLHISQTGYKNCRDGSGTIIASAECDLDCATVAKCNITTSFSVSVTHPCELPPKDISGGIGGEEAPPPDVGGLF